MLKRMPMRPAPPPVRGRVFIRKERCKGCKFCIEFCPQDVLALSKDFNAKGYHYPVVVKDVCINCTLCLSLCPDYAILSLPVPADEEPTEAATSTPKTSKTGSRE
jgi:2-oxoglutarate ferredoxin oxidoreductase subunit delta